MRKLLSVTCLATILLALPSLVLAQVPQPISWGILKSRYGQSDTVSRMDVAKMVANAILTDPRLNDPNIIYVGKLGPIEQGYGYVGVGKNSAGVFLVYVNGNLAVTHAFDFDYIESMNQVVVFDVLNKKVLWAGKPEEFLGDVAPARDHVAPLGWFGHESKARTVTCSAVGGIVGNIVKAVSGPVGWFTGPVAGAIAGSWCAFGGPEAMAEAFERNPIEFDRFKGGMK